MTSKSLAPYFNTLSLFVASETSATEFEADFMTLFKNDAVQHDEEVYLILDGLFGDVDAFCDHPDLREEEDLDEDQLRQRCQVALEKLRLIESETAETVEKQG